MLTIVRRIPMEECFAAFHAAPLEAVPTGEEFFIYKNARIELRSVWPDEINLTTFYILQENLKLQYALREFFLGECGIDTLALSECIEFIPKGGNPEEPMMLMPPLVEVAEELVTFEQRLDSVHCERQLRVKMPVLKDGAHRMYMARECDERCSVLWVVGASSWDHPLYAYPNSWEDLRLYEDIAHVPLKKLYRRVPSRSYLRPLRALGKTGVVGRGEIILP